jgi:hypothetical protein
MSREIVGIATPVQEGGVVSKWDKQKMIGKQKQSELFEKMKKREV